MGTDLLLRSHKPLFFSLAGATVLHLSLFGVPIFDRGAVEYEKAGISTLSVNIAQSAVQPKTAEPATSDVKGEVKPESLIEKNISTSGVKKEKKLNPSTSPDSGSAAKKPQKTESHTPDVSPEPETQVSRNQQTLINEAIGSPEPPRQSQQVDPVKQWLGVLQQRINKHRRYPRAALSRNLAGDVEIEATVNPDGALAKARIVSRRKIIS